MKGYFEWENIAGGVERAPVFEGWIVRSRETDDCNTQYTVESVVFVPDKYHKWKL